LSGRGSGEGNVKGNGKKLDKWIGRSARERFIQKQSLPEASFSPKMHQKKFGGRATPGTAEKHTRSQSPLAAARGGNVVISVCFPPLVSTTNRILVRNRPRGKLGASNVEMSSASVCPRPQVFNPSQYEKWRKQMQNMSTRHASRVNMSPTSLSILPIVLSLKRIRSG
jgi:hypothetical protein